MPVAGSFSYLWAPAAASAAADAAARFAVTVAMDMIDAAADVAVASEFAAAITVAAMHLCRIFGCRYCWSALPAVATAVVDDVVAAAAASAVVVVIIVATFQVVGGVRNSAAVARDRIPFF